MGKDLRDSVFAEKPARPEPEFMAMGQLCPHGKMQGECVRCREGKGVNNDKPEDKIMPRGEPIKDNNNPVDTIKGSETTNHGFPEKF